MRSPFALVVLVVLLAFARSADAHGGPPGSFEDLDAAFHGCTAGCHEPGGQSSMWFNQEGDGRFDPEEGYAALVGSGSGAFPANAAALRLLKRRVDPGRPWNSYLLDKLTGKLKDGEGLPMPANSPGLYASDPRIVKKIEVWIRGGAPYTGFVRGDPCFLDVNQPEQPAYAGCGFNFELSQPATPVLEPPEPEDGIQLSVPSWSLTDEHEEERCFLFRMPGDGPVHATRIEGAVSAGTQVLLASRSADAVAPEGDVTCPAEDPEPPFLVLRSRPDDPDNPDPFSRTWVPQPGREDLDFPDGAGLVLDAGRAILVRHRIRADFAVRPDTSSPWTRGATGDATINLHLAAGEPARTVEPIVADALGRATIVVPPPRGVGAAVELWSSPVPVDLLALTVLADKHVRPPGDGSAAAEVGRVTPAGLESLYASDLADRAGYRTFESPVALDANEPLVVRCAHDNGDQRPLRYGCTDRVQGLLPIPEGLPGTPADWCDEDPPGEDDCPGASRVCGWANLVAGPGEDDARCTLLGLTIAGSD